MKIGIFGVTEARGRPLAALLREYHSVVGWSTGTGPLPTHPDPVVRAYERDSTLPIAPMLLPFLREATNLIIMDVPPDSVRASLHMIADGVFGFNLRPDGHRLPVVVVTPGARLTRVPLHAHRTMVVGFAPFDYHPRLAFGRLAHLQSINVAASADLDDLGRLLLVQTLAKAWAGIDNKIPVRVTPVDTRTPTSWFDPS